MHLDDPLNEPGGITALGRRLTWAGAALLVASLVAFVWAVGFSEGVDGLLQGVVIATAGFLLPAIAFLWIGWLLSNASEDGDADGEAAAVPVAASLQSRLLVSLRSYLIAVLAVGLAIMIRQWLGPYVPGTILTPPLLLAVTVSAWAGGLGPSLFATALSVPALWYWFMQRGGEADERIADDLVGLGLFATAALAIAGITSALRIAQSRSAGLRADVRARKADCQESETRFRALADEATALIWMSDATDRCTYFNRAWLAFTGHTMEQALADGWTGGVHPQDTRRCAHTLRLARERLEPFALECLLRHADGDYRRVAVDGRLRIDRDGKFVGLLGICKEVPDNAATSG